ncbi:helix-turn-helix domain-containing protein [Parageobacillus thermoglucosidasius]|uniref:helix-turn-helix domain-containing protein n=1 Tax=Parageobacillus thermoglucosidasius TaxID=1426 RepID=UPI000E13DB0F|nr:helix-turn-helix transcriptional regulator [Parageobacillus thermoglucosidasius]MED4903975.1 helix-turn-helix transcriptional regulator [Parageobacillus thermoglucosidasius]MED4915701.1 helix-turn-helix transcriptional regulator [Parageobacillus thermoglucosidasius]MED4945534.1 helix-turn-helix transcriptional regulator [Parageobacillus thermoglucosidasius]MED4984101.1 helix-turn-helix transcriptional regulator [Parageobacillus thermoglucosidasius]RDE18572.1 XRE family transcriptional regul
MAIRIHISEWLGKKKWTQKQLSEITGIRPATISALYHETIKRIEIEQINELCKAFNCQPGDLMTYVPDEEYTPEQK